jgi:RHS repeat-associated protein
VDVVNYQYDEANRLTSVNGQAYTWDNNGNLLSDGLRSYTYTHANRLTQVVSGTLTTGFTYNGVGDRVARTVDGVTTGYVLDPAAGLTQVLVETTGGQATSYLYGADLLAQYDSGTWAYHVNDGLGSVRQLADPAGQVVASYSFSPFGVPLGESGGEPYGYTGEQWDASAGLVYLRARYMQPTTGRFVSKDPWPGNMWQPQTLNRFAYAQNNPILLVDPSGRQVPSEQQETINYIVRKALTGMDALIELFETDLLPETQPSKTTAQVRLELVLEATNRRIELPGGISIDAGIHFKIDFCNYGLREEFRDDWLYLKYWHQNPWVSNQIGHFLTAVRLGYDPSFLAAESGLSARAARQWLGRPQGISSDESLDTTAKRLIVGHEKVADPEPTGSEKADALLTFWNIPKQYEAAKARDVSAFDLAVMWDRAGRDDLRDDHLRSILVSPNPEEWGSGNSLEDLRLSVKGWRLGRVVAGKDREILPGQFDTIATERMLNTRQEVADWLRTHVAASGLLIVQKGH